MSNGLMRGKRGLIMGLANDKSMAWGIAKALHAAGAEIAISYQGEVMKKRALPLAEQLDAPIVASGRIFKDHSAQLAGSGGHRL